jgi:hypothetical protein
MLLSRRRAPRRHRSTRRSRALLALAGTALIALVVAPSAFAVVQPNDNLESPFNVDLVSGFPVTADTRGNTTQPGEVLTAMGPGVCNPNAREMLETTWYRIVGNGGVVSIDTFGSNFNTVISVYNAPTPALDDGLPCNDDAPGNGVLSFLSFQSIAGKAYLIQVGGCSGCGTVPPANFTSGDLVMHVSATAPPPVDPVVVPGPAPQPVVIVPPDRDGDGIPDARDACPTVKPTVDANNDGCQDKPKRILSTIKYTFKRYRISGRVQGFALLNVRLLQVPAGAHVRVSCSACKKADSRGRARRFRGFGLTVKKGGTQPLRGLNRVLLPGRGRGRLVVVVTSPGQLGRRVVVTIKGDPRTRDPGNKYACLEVGSTSQPLPCSSGS